MRNDITNEIWTKKKNIDKETERLIELYRRAYKKDAESPRTKALEAELKRRNPADVNAIIYDAIRRIVALNKAAEKYPIKIDFQMEFGRELIRFKVGSLGSNSARCWLEELLEKDKTLPDEWTCFYNYYWMTIYEEDEPEYFLAKWEEFMGLR